MDPNKKDLSLFSSNRKEEEGWTGLIIKNIYNTSTIAQGKLHTFQFAKWKTRIDHTTLTIVGVNRPPSGSNLDFFGRIYRMANRQHSAGPKHHHHRELQLAH